MIQANNSAPVQAFPLKPTTAVFATGVGAYEVKDDLIVHMSSDGQIICHYNVSGTPAQITVDATAGSDWAISREFDSIEVSSGCVISRA